MSNELEFSLHGIPAEEVILAIDLPTIRETKPVVHEINPRDIIELNVSFAPTITELNARLADYVGKTRQTVTSLGGEIYGGSSLLESVHGITPRWYRTTALSETCGFGLLDITSQQIIIGIPDEQFGFELYNFLRAINPVLIAMSASSPYAYRKDHLEDTLGESRRIRQYEQLCQYFPESLWRELPPLHSLTEYGAVLRSISDEVNRRLLAGELDANMGELRRQRSNGHGPYSYIPFDVLEPHQIYWTIRVRPDHGNMERGGSSLFSLELRLPDMPTTVARMQMLNAFVLGLAYHIADHGTQAITSLSSGLHGTFDELYAASRDGLDAQISGGDMRGLIGRFMPYAARGLEERGHGRECSRLDTLDSVLRDGNDAQLIRTHIRDTPPSDRAQADMLRQYLVTRLATGE